MVSTSDRICALVAAAHPASVRRSYIVQQLGAGFDVRTRLTLLLKTDAITRTANGTRDSSFSMTDAQLKDFDKRMAPLLDYFKRRIAA